MMEFLKIVASLLGGGLAGVLLNEWFRRRRSGVQRIPLIERVNRRVSSELKGFTLARTVDDPSGRKLEEVRSLREYQLTLRNSSFVHLKDAEVQFEFPADEVQGWASRPVLSKTALVLVSATAAPPWKSVYRWRIPHLPAGDSVEFTFQAVNPESQKYEAALYHSDGVILDRVEGEPQLKRERAGPQFPRSLLVLMVPFVILLAWATIGLSESRSTYTRVALGGCELHVETSVELYGPPKLFLWEGPWKIEHRITNIGTQDCTFRSSNSMVPSDTLISIGEALQKGTYSVIHPKLVSVEIWAGRTSASLTSATVRAYEER